MKKWSKNQSLGFQESKILESKVNLNKYSDNELLAIQEFAFQIKRLVGPIWIQNFLDDLLYSIKKEWKVRE